MRDNRLNYVIVGGFVLAALVGLVAAVAALSGRTGATETYFTHFGNVIGLKVGTQVLYEGYPVGEIDAIELGQGEDGRPRYRLTLSVLSEVGLDAESEVLPTAPGFLSAVVLDIQSGRSGRLLEPGGTLASRPSADVVGALSDVAGQVNVVMEESLRPMLEELSQSLPAAAENLERITARASALLGEENVTRVSNILRNLEDTSGDAAALVADLRQTRLAIDRVLGRVDDLVAGNEASIDQAVLDLQYTLDSVARRIDAVTHNLEGTTRNFNEFSRQIRANPGLLIGGREPVEGPNGDGR